MPAPRAVRDLALISLLACTGLRRSEAAQLMWADVQAADPAGRIFPLSGRQIGRIVAARAQAAGLGGGYSGHSGRVGLAITMTRKQAPTAAVQRQGRWQSTRMIARYTRNESAGEALRYL